jgi:LemA protein
MQMNGKMVFLIVAGILIFTTAMCAFWFIGVQNSFVVKRVDTEAKWSQVQNQYQRRYDLIPRLVNSTKLYINYEGKLLTDITEARSQWGKSLSEQPTQSQIEAQGQLDSVISRLMVIVTSENYPELKADKLVQSLMDELAGTENRISVERLRYIQSVQEYNTALQLFPGNIIAGMMNLHPLPNYQANPNAQDAPNVTLG